MKNCSFRRIALLFLTATLGVVIPLAAQILKQADLRKAYGPLWIVLPFPDSRIGPGSIVTVSKGSVGLDSTLASCGAPASVMKPNSGETKTPLQFKGDGAYDASANLGFQEVSAGADFSKVKKTSLTMSQHGPEGLDVLAIGEWMNDPKTKLSKTCVDYLASDNVFIVLEAYKVTKGKYTFYGDDAASAKLSNLTLGLFKIGAGAKLKTTQDGTVEFEEPVYTAIRRLKRTKDGSLKTLGQSSSEKFADTDAMKLLY
jgi:hypothetical protein